MKNFITNRILWHVSSFGTAIFMLAAALFAFLVGKHILAFQLFAGLVLSFIVVFPLKMLLFRDRPEKRKHSSWIEKFDASAFPSVHSNRAALMLVILSFFFAQIPLALFLFAVSIAVAYSRVYLKRHFWTDVVVGYALGILEGLLIILLIQ